MKHAAKGIVFGLVVTACGEAAPPGEDLETGQVREELQLWSGTLDVGTTTGVVVDTAMRTNGESAIYIGKGAQFRKVADVTPGWTGGSALKFHDFPTALVNAPLPMSSSMNGTFFTYMTHSDGFLYKFDDVFNNSSSSNPIVFVDTRRPGFPSDTVAPGLAVQRYAASNAAFRTNMDAQPPHSHDDIIIVGTRMVPSTTQNRFIAYYASNLAVKWTFNATGNYSIASTTDACTVDLVRNRAYCPAQTSTATQPLQVIALNTLNGAVAWAASLGGSVLGRPRLANGRVYVATDQGALFAIDATTPAVAWGVQLPGPVTSPVWVEDRGATPAKLFVVTSGGTRALRLTDAGSTVTADWAWDPPNARISGAPTADPQGQKVYFSMSTGVIQQLSWTGQVQGFETVQTGAPIFDPVLDTDPGGTSFTKIIGVSPGIAGQNHGWGVVRAFTIPFAIFAPGG